ncbi:MAG: glutathione synthase [Lysobacterales bacterium]
MKNPNKVSMAVVMDPISQINRKKDSTFAMLLEAQRRQYTTYYVEPKSLWISNGKAMAAGAGVTVQDNSDHWYDLAPQQTLDLGKLDLVLMRKDPPFDMEYVADTYVLDRAQAEGALVVNKPAALRDINEKAAICGFPELTPPTLVARDHQVLREFVLAQDKAIVKPLDGMGGHSIFKVSADDPNLNVVLETVSNQGQNLIMAQGYVPQITEGDKRILMIEGEPVPYALARIPAADDFRGNLAKGGQGVAVELSEGDRAIASAVGPMLVERGVIFAGLDVIGDRLTEINVTSPTCIRELDAAYNLNIAGQLFDCLERKLKP